MNLQNNLPAIEINSNAISADTMKAMLDEEKKVFENEVLAEGRLFDRREAQRDLQFAPLLDLRKDLMQSEEQVAQIRSLREKTLSDKSFATDVFNPDYSVLFSDPPAPSPDHGVIKPPFWNHKEWISLENLSETQARYKADQSGKLNFDIDTGKFMSTHCVRATVRCRLGFFLTIHKPNGILVISSSPSIKYGWSVFSVNNSPAYARADLGIKVIPLALSGGYGGETMKHEIRLFENLHPYTAYDCAFGSSSGQHIAAKFDVDNKHRYFIGLYIEGFTGTQKKNVNKKNESMASINVEAMVSSINWSVI